MIDPILKELDVTNFRSIRGHVHAPLDANVVLVHGENGAGKTSLLSAIELALTGRIQSLQRADAGYAKQLLHRGADQGSVLLRTIGETGEGRFETLLDAKGSTPRTTVDSRLAAFFGERAYLPQSLLGQLLQIYQEAGSDKDSPLAKFVGKLLGLDRLDALEAGLKPFHDVRNMRKVVAGWSVAETDKTRLERLLEGQRKTRTTLASQADETLRGLADASTALAIEPPGEASDLDALAEALSDRSDDDAYDRVADQLRRLGAIEREIADARQSGNDMPVDGALAAAAYANWQSRYGERWTSVRARVEALLPEVQLPSEVGEFADEASARLRAAAENANKRVEQLRADQSRLTGAEEERATARQQRDIMDAEIATISSNAGSLAAALSELTAFVDSDICPVCDRDYADLGDGSLSDHVHGKIRTLSGSAERLLTLGRSRGESQVRIERLDREIEGLSARVSNPKALADLEREAAELAAAQHELESIAGALAEGGRLLAADIAARRLASEAQSRSVALLSSRATLTAFAEEVGAHPLTDSEDFDDALQRLQAHLAVVSRRLGDRLTVRRQSLQQLASLRTVRDRLGELDAQIESDTSAWRMVDNALTQAQGLRDQALAVRGAVDTVRASIIRREFNDRLNKLWRDLFIRLAPNEPFVPAFRIPTSSTQRLQPQLITEHRLGGRAGGTPGAMLSAGNLNTAALTLFIALHLSVPKELPWLILDDPVQSMDDVHIAHFAALLRTLSKEQGRQVVIAVHDRQLFEYLRLELSPAFPEDSLLTLELSRGQRRDTICTPERYSFKEETVLMAAA